MIPFGLRDATDSHAASWEMISQYTWLSLTLRAIRRLY